MKYVAIHTYNEILHIRKVEENTRIICKHLSTVRNSRQEIINLLLNDNFTQEQIDEKLPEEYENE